MSRKDMQEVLEVENDKLDALLTSLENQGSVKLIRTRKGIELAKATYDGLDKAHPPEYYRWFPSWIEKDKDRVF